MLSIGEAQEKILSLVTAASGSEQLPLRDVQGRILSRDVVAPMSLPPFDNSAMDGYAAKSLDLPAELPLVGESAANGAQTAALAAKTCMRISTGAKLPSGADCVVMQENVTVQGATVALPATEAGQNVRAKGSDVQVGDEVLARATRLGPAEIAMLAALGIEQVPIIPRLRVAVFSTGSELVDVGNPLAEGQIYSSNNWMLCAALKEIGCEPIDLGIVKDDLAATKARLREALAYDAVISSGGVSVGDHDFVKPALHELGIALEFWKVAMKPGKPLAFAHTDRGKLFFGLPGNPVSSFVTFELFVRPALLKKSGSGHWRRPVAAAHFAQDFRKEAGRANMVRVIVERRLHELWATPLSKQGSGQLTSLSGTNGLAEISAETTHVTTGDLVPVHLLQAV